MNITPNGFLREANVYIEVINDAAEAHANRVGATNPASLIMAYAGLIQLHLAEIDVIAQKVAMRSMVTETIFRGIHIDGEAN
ncbi:MAG: hypothetical protein JKY96_01470 [Phycisphaerales bacterium]|nr:hypothetical protein [Phycisphaerales bacterium]